MGHENEIADKFNFFQSLRVRWAEVDAQGIVFNPHYLMYADIGVTEYYRAIGMPYPDAFDTEKADLYTKKTQIEYHAPARYDDELRIYVRVSRLGRSSFDFDIKIVNDQTLLASIQITYVNANLKQGTSVPIDAGFKAACKRFEKMSPE